MNLVEWRRRCRFTQAELAQKIGVTVSTVSNWEQGRTGLESLARAIRLARVMGMSLDEFENAVEEQMMEGDRS